MSVKYWDKAWSLVEGCTPVSEACDHCWLAGMQHRFKHAAIDHSTGKGYDMTDNNGQFSGVVIPRPSRLNIPLKTRKPTVFAIWSDLFHEKVPGPFIRDAFEFMSHPKCTHHTFLVLTKRPERIKILFEEETDFYLGGGDYLPNVWLGTTVENQLQADIRIPRLLAGAGEFKKFLSVEPMLELVDILPFIAKCSICGHIKPDQLTCPNCTPPFEVSWQTKFQAVICGGESGFEARPMHPDWVRSLRDQCKAAGVPFTFKQWGEWTPDCLCHTKQPHKSIPRPILGAMFKCGTKKAGHLLDGKEYINLPWRKP